MTGSLSLRMMPFVVPPLPDEPLLSWLETMAATYRATVAEVAVALGIAAADVVTAQRAATWAVDLTGAQRANITATTGIASADVAAMTIAGSSWAAFQRNRRGWRSAGAPTAGSGAGYCPECLTDASGRWRLSWQLPFAYGCVRHRRLLLNRCPACQRAPRRNMRSTRRVPTPGHCDNIVQDVLGGRRHRCGADLRTAPVGEPLHADDLDAQRAVAVMLSTGLADFGIYQVAPQPARAALHDLHLLSRLLRKPSRLPSVRPPGAAPEVGADPVSGRASAADVAAGSVVVTAAGVIGAVAALHDEDTAIGVLRGRIAHSTAYAQHTPQLQTLIARALGRHRRPTATLHTAGARPDPQRRARQLPALLWEEWVFRLTPNRMDQHIAASALAAATVFTGTALTLAAALALLDPKAPTRRVTNVMRTLGGRAPESGTLTCLIALATYLDTHSTPIDYHRRRQLDYRPLLPEQQWRQICAAGNVHPGSGRRWRCARAVLYRMISGSAATDSTWPGEGCINAAELSRFTASATAPMLALLRDTAAAFLMDRGITEPVTWTPPAALLDAAPPLIPTGRLRRWPDAAREAYLPAADLRAAFLEGMSVTALAAEHHVPRHTIASVLTSSGVHLQPGRRHQIRVDAAALRHEYVDLGWSAAQIARRSGCGSTTVLARLRAEGIPIRAGYGAAPAGDADDLLLDGRVVLPGPGAQRDAAWLLTTITHPTVTAAARTLGIAPGTLTAHLRRISTHLGAPVLQRPALHNAIELTPQGRQLAADLEKILR